MQQNHTSQQNQVSQQIHVPQQNPVSQQNSVAQQNPVSQQNPVAQPNHSSLIFPKNHPLPQILGSPRLKSDVMQQIQNDPGTHSAFQALSQQEQEAFLGFCMGERGLKVTYDPFFKYIFHPEARPGRLDRLLSCILGQKVIVKKMLSTERRPISENGSLVILDILVQLTDGRLVNVEMQRAGYDFPIERSFCYGADLLVRQYDVVKDEQGQRFSYRSINPVIIIVLMEESPALFHSIPTKYIHRSRFSFDTGLKMTSLQNFIYISLDIFRQTVHNKPVEPDVPMTELEAWMYFLSSDEPADILRIIREFPFFQRLYQDIVNFRFKPKELISMYSEALRIMDENTIKYMIDELKEQLAVKTHELSKMGSELSKKDSQLSIMGSELSKQNSEIEKLRAQLAKYEQ